MCPAQPCLFAAPTGHAEPSGAGCIHGTGAAGPCGHDGRAACQRAPLCHVAWERAMSQESPISLQHQHHQHHQWLLPHAPVPAALAPTAVTPFAQEIHLPLSLLIFFPVFLPVSSHLILFPTLPLPRSSICLAVHPARLCSCWGDKCRREKPGEHPEVSAQEAHGLVCSSWPQGVSEHPKHLLHRACWGAHLQQAASSILQGISWRATSNSLARMIAAVPGSSREGRDGTGSLHEFDNDPEKRERWYV